MVFCWDHPVRTQKHHWSKDFFVLEEFEKQEYDCSVIVTVNYESATARSTFEA